MTKQECYLILELPINASMQEVRKSYIKLSKKYHPDVNPHGKHKFQKINEAYNRIRSNEFSVRYFGNITDDGSSHDIYRKNIYTDFEYEHFKDLLNELKTVYKNTSGRTRVKYIGRMLLFVVLVLWGFLIFFGPIVMELIYFVIWIIELSYTLIKDVIMMFLYILTLVVMNVIDLMIDIVILLYTITIKPIFLLANFLFSVMGSTIRELRMFIVVSIIIVILIKVIEQVGQNKRIEKIFVFLFSIITLLVLVLCDLMLEK